MDAPASPTAPSSWARRSPQRRYRLERLAFLGVTAIGLAVVLFVGFQRPLDHASHPAIATGFQPLASVYGLSSDGMDRFTVAVIAAFTVYTLAAFFASRVGGWPAFWLVIAGTIACVAVLVPTNPAGAQDVYHNIADARTLWLYGENPAVTPPDAHPNDPFFTSVPAWPDTPSSYGPLWYGLSTIPLPFTGSEVWPNVVGQKVLTSAFLVAATVLVMLSVGRLRPGSAALAGVLVGWNPLLLFETAVNAHNDIVMVTFALAAFYALVRRRWLYVFPLLALAVAVKYVMVLLVPGLLLWMLLRRDVPRIAILGSLALGVVVGLLAYAPFIAGGALFDTLRGEGTRYLLSPGSMIVAYLLDNRGDTITAAEVTMRRVLVASFAVGVVLLLARFRRDPSYGFLVFTSAAVMFVALVTVKWWFWPWYVTWLVPIAALAPRRPMALLAVVFSLTSMLLYAAYYWHVYGEWQETQRLVFRTVFAVPLSLALALVLLWLARMAWTAFRPRGAGPGSSPARPSTSSW